METIQIQLSSDRNESLKQLVVSREYASPRDCFAHPLAIKKRRAEIDQLIDVGLRDFEQANVSEWKPRDGIRMFQQSLRDRQGKMSGRTGSLAELLMIPIKRTVSHPRLRER